MWVEEINGNYFARDRYKDPLTGKLKKVSVKMDRNTPQARNKAKAELDSMIVAKSACVANGLLFSQIVDLYMNELKKTVKPSTFRTATHRTNKLCRNIGNVKADKMTAGIARHCILTMADTPTSRNTYTKQLKAIMRWAYRNDLVENIMWIDKLTAEKDVRPGVKVADKFLESWECEKLLDAMEIDLWRNLATFILLSGLRVGEAIALFENDIDLEKRTISVNKTHNAKDGDTTPKTATSNRTVYMQADLYHLTRCIIASNAKNVKVLPFNGRRLFSRYDGSEVSYHAFRKYLLQTSCNVLGKKATPHMLRHSHASLLAENGVDYEIISRRLGHENSNITKEIYIHVTEKRQQAENDALKFIKII